MESFAMEGEISMQQLSTPDASKAESRCSTVETMTPSLRRVVQRGDSSTKSMEDGIILEPILKYLPVLASSGHNLTLVDRLECRPIPCFSIDVLSVFWSLPVWKKEKKESNIEINDKGEREE